MNVGYLISLGRMFARVSKSWWTEYVDKPLSYAINSISKIPVRDLAVALTIIKDRDRLYCTYSVSNKPSPVCQWGFGTRFPVDRGL